MNRPRIAVVTPGSFIIPSGRSSSVERVIEKIVPLASDRLDITVFGKRGEHMNAREKIGDVPCIRVAEGAAYYPSILSHLKSWQPEAVDVHNRPALAYLIKQNLPGVRVILSLHSTTFIKSRNPSRSLMISKLRALDGISVNSDYLRREVQYRYPGLSLPMYVNHLGASLEDFLPRWTPVGEGLRQGRMAEYGWSGRKIVLFVGRLIPEKGVHALLKTVPHVARTHPDVLFVVVGSAFYSRPGETSYVRHLKGLASSWPDHVIFQPFTPYPRVADWYNLADVVVVPSGQEEAFGLVNVEAMASGIPVIASDAGGIPEVVEHGHSGFLIPSEHLDGRLADGIVRLLNDEKLRRQMGTAGLEAIRSRFRWRHTADRFISIFSSKQA
ncbi:glycosyltransferase family 4 protein [Paenibacillus antibioticophila]|uniref:glycosyltransferase family 4 protein n=1 Tax=Paenibacillus antibioticophila TaxID=1274374 RepID=UPI0005C98DC3|nr:glycosyltransferase family 4 protein [Paenibacillus antibioticophila]